MADFLVQEEDGTSRLTLEEGGGSLLLEESVATVGDGPPPGHPLLVTLGHTPLGNGPPLVKKQEPAVATTYVQVLVATVTTSASIRKAVAKTLTAAVSATASFVADYAVHVLPRPLLIRMRQQQGPPLLQKQEPILPPRIYQQALTATVTTTATIAKAIAKTLTATVSATAGLAAQIFVETFVRPLLIRARLLQGPPILPTPDSTDTVIGRGDMTFPDTPGAPLLMTLRHSIGPPLLQPLAPIEVSQTNTRVAQISTETLLLPTSQNAVVAQVSTEALLLPTSQNAVVAQISTEALLLPTSQNARVAQVSVEVLMRNIHETYSVIWGD